ncbi:MAG: sulfotransferase [Verrucomicrobia bacterium]|nr:sulfotransferase [Verrucomicrobiota bacterium]
MKPNDIPEQGASPILDTQPPTALRAINGTARFLNRAGLVSFNPSPDALIHSARKRTGLGDFGPWDFDKELREFVGCFRDQPRLKYTGIAGLKEMVRNGLERRLCLQRDIQVHPEILGQEIHHPFYVVGFPRSGTTLMQNLLIQHPGCRWMRPWETMTPFPCKADWGGPADPRVARYHATAARVKRRYPTQDQIHSWDNPGECWLLLYASFVAPQLLGSVVLDSYRAWWEKLPPTAFAKAYQFYRLQLQYLTWCQNGSHWVLKETSHMTQLDHLLGCFPDARIVQTHRDPGQFMGSICSLIYYQFRCYDSVQGVTPEEVGRLLLQTCSVWAARNVALRRQLDAASFFDVPYPQLVEEPLEVTRRIYHYFGMEFSPDLQSKIEEWLRRHHGIHRPRHHYDLAQFGLRADQVKEAFKPYCDYFDL